MAAATRDGMTLRLGSETIHFPPIFTEAAGRSEQKDVLALLESLLTFNREEFDSTETSRAITNLVEDKCIAAGMTQEEMTPVFERWITSSLKLSIEKMASLVETHINTVYQKEEDSNKFKIALNRLVQAEFYLIQDIFSVDGDHTLGPYSPDFECHYKKAVQALASHCHMIFGEYLTKTMNTEVNKCAVASTREQLLADTNVVISQCFYDNLRDAYQSATLFDPKAEKDTRDPEVMAIYSEILAESKRIKPYIDLKDELRSIINNNSNFADAPFFSHPFPQELYALKRLIDELDFSDPNLDNTLVKIRQLALRIATRSHNTSTIKKTEQILTCIQLNPVWNSSVQPRFEDMNNFQELHNSLLTSVTSIWGQDTTPSVQAIKEILQSHYPNTSAENMSIQVEEIYQFFSHLSIGIAQQIKTYQENNRPKILSDLLEQIATDPTYQKYCELSATQATIPCKIS